MGMGVKKSNDWKLEGVKKLNDYLVPKQREQFFYFFIAIIRRSLKSLVEG